MRFISSIIGCLATFQALRLDFGLDSPFQFEKIAGKMSECGEVLLGVILANLAVILIVSIRLHYSQVYTQAVTKNNIK